MARHVSRANCVCDAIGYRKAKEACKRLESFAPDFDDDNSRVTGDQWREMSKELLALEKILADTKAFLQECYRAVTASTMGFVD